jgi:hypothetical protein
MNVCYRVELSQAERSELTTLLSGGKHAARKLKRTQILLAADAGASDDEIARAVAVGGSDTSRPILLISVMQESLVRAKTHAQFIEQRMRPILVGGRPARH